jgi:hypothetical protein
MPATLEFLFSNRATTPLSTSADAQDFFAAGASRYIFAKAAAEHAEASSIDCDICSPFSVRISETISTHETSNFCSSASSTSRSYAYRPVRPEQVRAAIQHSRPHTLATSQRLLHSPSTSQGLSDASKLQDPFRKVVVGRAVIWPLVQVRPFVIASRRIPLMFEYFEQIAKAAPFTDAAAAPAAERNGSERNGSYILNSANYQTRVVTHGRQVNQTKHRDAHLVAVHNLNDVLELNAALASTAAAMRLPTRTKVASSISLPLICALYF